MKPRALKYYQQGATLIVGLIMLAIITVMVATAFSFGSTNLKSVSNMQFRSEALAAANKALEQVISSPFTSAPQASQILVDIDNDNTNDYVVNIAQPTCIRATRTGTSKKSQLSNSGMEDALMSYVTDWNTIWEINTTVRDATSGASVQTRSGVRVVLTNTQKQAQCP